MGSGPITAAVADAGPLVHLSEIACIALLSTFSTLHIPGAVWRETVGQNRVSADQVQQLKVVRRHRVRPAEVKKLLQENKLEGLHEGESECLLLCQKLQVQTLLTDDLTVREAARRLHLTPVGSLGVVVRAYRLGRISLADAERCMAQLYGVSSLFVTRAIVDLAIEELRRHAKTWDLYTALPNRGQA